MHMIRLPFLGLFALVLALALASPALAAKKKPVKAEGGGEACYSRAAFEADQILELHTELMIVGLKCRAAYPLENPFGVYNDFTRQHRSLIAGAEHLVIEQFHGRGTQQFDSFRTELANQVSRRAALIGETDYCALMVPLALKTPALTDDEVRKLLADDRALHLARRPPCTPVKPAGQGAAKMQ